MKYYTTIEQSKKLIELGLNPMTADMLYTSLDNFKEPWVWNSKPGMHPSDVPCWSTEALLDILDETIVTEEDDEYRLNFGKDGTSYYMFYEDVYRLKDNVIEELDFSCSTLLECTFEMIVKLKELKLK